MFKTNFLKIFLFLIIVLLTILFYAPIIYSQKVTLEELEKWKQIGITSTYTIKELKKAGIDLNEAKQWKQSLPKNYTPYAWIMWKKSGISPKEAKGWVEIGVKDLSKIKELKAVGIDLNLAKEWCNTGLSSYEWIEWYKSGISPQEAKEWVKAGIHDLYSVQSYKKYGINFHEAQEWAKVGIKSIYEIINLKRIGIQSPQDKKGWDSTGLTSYEIKEWIKHGLTWEEAKKWIENGFTNLNEILEWKSKAFTPEKAKQQKIAEEKRRMQKEKIKNFSFKVLFLILSILIIIGIMLGITDKAVFYMDTSDLTLSFMPYIIVLLSFFISRWTWKWILDVGLIISSLIIIVVFYKSIQYNKNFFKGISTAIAKLFLSFVYIIRLLEALNPSGKTIQEKRYKRSTALVWLAFLTPLLYRLVNGNRVLTK